MSQSIDSVAHPGSGLVTNTVAALDRPVEAPVEQKLKKD